MQSLQITKNKLKKLQVDINLIQQTSKLTNFFLYKNIVIAKTRFDMFHKL